MNQMNNHGRDKLGWGEEIWNRIDQAVHDEAQRTKVAAKFLPLYMATPGALIVPAEQIVTDNGNRKQLSVLEEATKSIVELVVEFTETPQQYERESGLMTAVTLATRATNLLSQGADLAIFQGEQAIQRDSLFTSGNVRRQSGSAGNGLLIDEAPTFRVSLAQNGQSQWGENTFREVAKGYAHLQNLGHYGPYALVLPTLPYADTYAPLETTLIMPADRIKPLVTAGFFGTGTLPDFTGVLVSIGGNTMDLVVGIDATTEFVQNDTGGQYVFRVYERFALRLKDETAVVKLQFEEPLTEAA